MFKKFGIIFFLVGFLIFSFAGGICIVGKMKPQEIAELIGTIAEEEDETEKDSKSESDDFIEIMESMKFGYVSIAHNFFSYNSDPIPLFNPRTLIQPPEFFMA